MEWSDIAAIVFACTSANHLGLVTAAEQTIKHQLPIVNCSKCFSFWSTLLYQLISGYRPIESLAISFLAAYAALWLELTEGLIDKLYLLVYEKIYPTDSDNPSAADAGNGDSAGALPHLRQ